MTKLKDSTFALRNTATYAATVKNSIAVENLQEVDIIFSDKTGTLTKNKMTFYAGADSNHQTFNVHKLVMAKANDDE